MKTRTGVSFRRNEPLKASLQFDPACKIIGGAKLVAIVCSDDSVARCVILRSKKSIEASRQQ